MIKISKFDCIAGMTHRNLTSFVTTGLVAASLLTIAEAQEQGKKKYNTPKQPWSNYTVHQMDRPHPVKVKNQGAVTTTPPEGAIVLFDGKNSDAFEKAWKVADGILVASPGSTRTKQSFGSMRLHMEWRIPTGRKVNGQSGGNSGVFLMGRYEVQVQESHTNITYADGQAAAIYGQTPPAVNASAPQGEWQSYEIIFHAPVYGKEGIEKPAYMTVVHNGVVVHAHQTVSYTHLTLPTILLV